MTCDLCAAADWEPLLEKHGAGYRRCRACGFICTDQSPGRSDEANEDYFSGSLSKYVAKGYAASKQRRYRKKLGIFEPARQLNRILEVGANVGGFLYCARNAGWDAVGVEPVDACARYGRETHGLDILTATLEEAALPAASFDGVFANAVFEHLPAPSRVFAEVARVLRPGGVAFIDTVNYASYTVRFIGADWKLIDPRVHLCLYTPRTLRMFCDRAGLEVLGVSTHGVRLRANHLPRLRGLARWGEELLKLPFSAASRVTKRGDSIAVLARRPTS